MRESRCQPLQQFTGFGDFKPAHVRKFGSTLNIRCGRLREEAKHQRLRERPGLGAEIPDILYLNAALLLYFAEDRLFRGFTRFHKAGQCRIDARGPGWLAAQQTTKRRPGESREK